ncbi:hypothetical protein TNCV_350501 [Trichonephila clavipes]|nr:hypothetical protein TNCV_350501 [Trichonephila clavipes]
MTRSVAKSPRVAEQCDINITHSLQPSITEDPPCRRTIQVKSVEAQTSPCLCDVEVRIGGYQLRCRPRRLTMV